MYYIRVYFYSSVYLMRSRYLDFYMFSLWPDLHCGSQCWGRFRIGAQSWVQLHSKLITLSPLALLRQANAKLLSLWIPSSSTGGQGGHNWVGEWQRLSTGTEHPVPRICGTAPSELEHPWIFGGITQSDCSYLLMCPSEWRSIPIACWWLVQ